MWFVAYSTHISLNEKLSWPDKVKVHGQVEWRANLFQAVVLIPCLNIRSTRGDFQSYQNWTLDLRDLKWGPGIGVNLEVSPGDTNVELRARSTVLKSGS